MPPILGIGVVCTLRMPGWSSAPIRRASQITSGVAIKARYAEPK